MPPDQKRRPAIFLDRDGTLIEPVPYLADSTAVRLLPGAADALRLLREAGFALVLITNQSGIGRGLLTVETLHQIHDVLAQQLADHGLSLDAIYYCPVAPSSDNDPTAIDHPDRKPAPGMLLKAAADLNLDLDASWMIGDMISDALAGQNAGCRGSLLVRTGHAPLDADLGYPFPVLENLPAAAQLILDSA